MGIDVLVKVLNPSLRRNLARLMLATSSILTLVVFYNSVIVVTQKWDELMPTIDITAAVYYIPVLISMIHCFLHLLLLAVAGPDIWRKEDKS